MNKIINLENLGLLIFIAFLMFILNNCYKVNILVSLIIIIVSLLVVVSLRPYLRIYNLSSVDIIATLVLAYYVAPCFNSSRIIFVLLSVPFSVLFHKIFQVNTPLTKLVFG
jgi:hypothetical protein